MSRRTVKAGLPAAPASRQDHIVVVVRDCGCGQRWMNQLLNQHGSFSDHRRMPRSNEYHDGSCLDAATKVWRVEEGEERGHGHDNHHAMGMQSQTDDDRRMRGAIRSIGLASPPM